MNSLPVGINIERVFGRFFDGFWRRWRGKCQLSACSANASLCRRSWTTNRRSPRERIRERWDQVDNLLARFQLDFTRFQLDFSIPLKRAGLAILEKNYPTFVFRCVLASLYTRVCPSVRPMVRPSVCWSVRWSVRHAFFYITEICQKLT